MQEILVGIVLLLGGIFFVQHGLGTYWHTKGYILKSEVVSAFKEYKHWKQSTFTSNAVQWTDADGNTHFYAVKDVEAAITRLNEVLRK